MHLHTDENLKQEVFIPLATKKINLGVSG